jgi:hypothetical protein
MAERKMEGLGEGRNWKLAGESRRGEEEERD